MDSRTGRSLDSTQKCTCVSLEMTTVYGRISAAFQYPNYENPVLRRITGSFSSRHGRKHGLLANFMRRASFYRRNCHVD